MALQQNFVHAVPVRTLDQETAKQQSADGFAPKPPPEGTALTLARALIIAKFCAGVVMLALSINAYSKFKAAADDVVNTADLWRAAPITGITTVAAGAACPTGFVALSPTTFSGTQRACDCPSTAVPSTGAFKTPGLYIQACNSSQTWCNEYVPLPSQPLYWRGVQMCVRTYTSTQMNAYNRPRASAATACPSGYQACNSGATMSEVFCAPSADVCPLTEIKFSTSSLSGYNCTQFASGASTTMFTCSKVGTSPWPIVKTAFNNYADSNGAMCWPGQASVKAISSSDVRVNNPVSSCAKADARWSVIDSQTTRNVYDVSTLGGTAIPNQPASSSLKYNRFLQMPATGTNYYYSAADFPDFLLGYEPEPAWTQTCPSTRADVSERVDKVTNIKSASLAMVILSAIGLVVVNFVIAWLEFVRLSEPEDADARAKHRIKNLISLLLTVAKMISTVVAYTAAAVVVNVLSGIATSACTGADSITGESFAIMSANVQEIFNNSKALVAVAVLEIFMITVDCYKVAKRSHQDHLTCWRVDP